MTQLTVENHDRDVAGLTYIYPVVSRRSGGISIGVNVNTNNACNWRCIYCQVPELIRGAAPAMDWALLQRELDGFLKAVQDGSFYQSFSVPEQARVIKDIAISGNGEATTLPNFERLVILIGDSLHHADIPEQPNFILITNGSMMHRESVQLGLSKLHFYQGQVWFKVDSATKDGIFMVNHTPLTPEKLLHNIVTSAQLCPTWLQTCMFSIEGRLWSRYEKENYLRLIENVLLKSSLEGVYLYTLARPSMQPEADLISVYPEQEMHDFADQIRTFGLTVKVIA